MLFTASAGEEEDLEDVVPATQAWAMAG